jgi:2'-phosphotransferase
LHILLTISVKGTLRLFQVHTRKFHPISKKPVREGKVSRHLPLSIPPASKQLNHRIDLDTIQPHHLLSSEPLLVINHYYSASPRQTQIHLPDMAPQDPRSNRGKKDKADGQGPGREVTVSKAMSWLLRHGAAKEHIAMDGQGYVKVDDLLKWHKLKTLGVGLEELVEVVEGNEKKRFALRWVGGGDPGENTTVAMSTDMTPMEDQQDQIQAETETQRAIQHVATDLDSSHYLIRATQGHSLKTLEASTYLTPITLKDEKLVPETVVHGTFYGAWERILVSEGLTPMSRVHVHFATGPKLEEILPEAEGVQGPGEGKKTDVVISGMRSDAQILIYVDIRKALKAGVEFWRSENGVVLTEGIVAEGGEGAKVLSSEFWDVVVEVKAGVGVLWKQGQGVVRELPAELKGRGMPRGKDRVDRAERGGRGRGNAKPKLRVERDDWEAG